MQFGSSSWSPFSDHSSVMVFTTLITVAQMEGFSPPRTPPQKKGRHQIASLALIISQVHPTSAENIRIQLQGRFCIHSLTYVFIQQPYSTCFISIVDINLNKIGPCPQVVQNLLGKIKYVFRSF